MADKVITIVISEKNVKQSYKVSEDQLQYELDSLKQRCVGQLNVPALVNTDKGFYSIPAFYFSNHETIITVK